MGTKQKGFTLVELLIVIVVIALLAAISVVAYSGVQSRAQDSAVQSDLQKVAKGLHGYMTVIGNYPTSETQISTMTDSLGAVVSEAKPKVSRSGYDTISPSSGGDTTVRNMIICVRGGTDSRFGVAAVTKSGTVWMYTSHQGLTKHASPWVGAQGTMCPRLGILTTDTGYARWFAYERPVSQPIQENGWRGWAAE